MKLSVAQGTALSVGAVLGTGVISMPALAAGVAGPASLVAWLALVLISAPLAGTFAALGARHPDPGGISTYARLAFGDRVSAAVGWCFYFAMPLGAPAAVAFAGNYAADVLGGGRRTVLATFVLVIVLVFTMNWFGLKISGRVQLALTGTLAGLLLITVLIALPHARAANLTPFAPHGLAGIGSAAAVLVWGFAGWEALAPLSAEYRDPRRDVPRATTVAVIVVGVLYLAIAVTSVLVLGPALAGSRAPLADLLAIGAGGSAGEPVRVLTAVVALLLTVGAVNAYMAGASRLGAALARDGALPARPFGTQRRSLIFNGAASLAAGVLPFSLHTLMLLVTGCFSLVYLFGTAAGVRLLPRGKARAGAAVSFVAVLALLWLTGLPALLSLVVAAAGVAYRAWRARSDANRATPGAIDSSSVEPKPNTKPACAPAS